MENLETREQQQTLIQKRGIALEWVTDLYTSGSHHKELLFFHISSEAVNPGKVFATGRKSGHCTLPETNMVPDNRPGHPKRKVVFQPSIFRWYVSFRECDLSLFSELKFQRITKSSSMWFTEKGYVTNLQLG